MQQHNRLSSLLPELITSTPTVWDVRGAIIEGPEDAFKLLQVVRTPYVEGASSGDTGMNSEDMNQEEAIAIETEVIKGNPLVLALVDIKRVRARYVDVKATMKEFWEKYPDFDGGRNMPDYWEIGFAMLKKDFEGRSEIAVTVNPVTRRGEILIEL